MRIIHHNFQYLKSIIDDLATWLNTCSGENVVFCFSEKWTKPDSLPLHVPGYQFLSSPFHTRPAAKHLSYLPGSCIFISNGLIVERNSICVSIEESCKLLNVPCCVINCKHSHLAIASVYRYPSISTSDCLIEIYNLISELSSFTKYVIVVGDFSINLLSTHSIILVILMIFYQIIT